MCSKKGCYRDKGFKVCLSEVRHKLRKGEGGGGVVGQTLGAKHGVETSEKGWVGVVIFGL